MNAAYAHACDNDWITVTLTAHTFQDMDRLNRADFALSTRPADVLFTFTSNDPDPSVFIVVGSDSNTNSVVRPGLRRITFDFTAGTFSGVCDDGSPCSSGTFDQATYLSFNLSSSDNSSTLLRSTEFEWSIGNRPIFILQDEHGARVLQASVAPDCTHMKVCVPANSAIYGGVLGPDVLVPVGWTLNQHAVQAVACSKPSNSSLN